jgi:hypothetical protein
VNLQGINYLHACLIVGIPGSRNALRFHSVRSNVGLGAATIFCYIVLQYILVYVVL